ncbi:MAG TPA: zinc-binding protein [Desulfobulbaceae bacterium]|nr:zinc-binding protein [Desulfobulbaceae bacterium]
MFPQQTGCSCGCNAGPKIIFSCSGAADVGALADQAARKLDRQGAGKMFCLAGVGGRVDNILKSTQAAGNILAIDGCAMDCARKTLEAAGILRVNHLRLTDLGFTKGDTEVDEASVGKVVSQARMFFSIR